MDHGQTKTPKGSLYGNRGLMKCHRLTATAGTDHHGQDVSAYDTFSDLRPAWNMVYAEHKTRAGIVAALRAGHSYVTAKPQLHLNARAGEQTWMMGDVIDTDHVDTDPIDTDPIDTDPIDTDQVTVEIAWEDVPEGAYVQLRVDGEVTHLGNTSSGQWQDTFNTAAFKWLIVEVWDNKGAWAFTNPLYGQS